MLGNFKRPVARVLRSAPRGNPTMMLVSLVVLAAFAFYVMNSEERIRALRPVGIALRHLKWAAELGLAGVRVFLVALLGRKRWAMAMLAGVAVLLVTAALHARYVRSLTDIRPELEQVLATEEKTVGAYDSAVGQFKLGALSSGELSKVITRSVLPELRAVRLRLKALDRVPAEHQPILARADRYLELRLESWRLRADALEKRNMAALKKAERAERESLDALRQVRLEDLQP